MVIQLPSQLLNLHQLLNNTAIIRHESAVLQYNLKRLAALNEESRQAVQDFAIGSEKYRLLQSHP